MSSLPKRHAREEGPRSTNARTSGAPDSVTPLQEYIREWKDKGQGTIRFFRQRSAILRDPRILQEARPDSIAGWKTPFAFAAYGLLFTSIAISATGFVLKTFFNVEPSEHNWFANSSVLTAQLKTNEELLGRANGLKSGETIPLTRLGESKEFERQEAISVLTTENHAIRITKALNAVFNWAFDYLQPVFLTLTIITASSVVKRSIIKNLPQSKFKDEADRFYLYIATSRLFWANLFFIVGFVADIFPLAAFGAAVGIYLLYCASKDLYAALDVPPPSSYWTSSNKTFSALATANLKGGFTIAFAEIVLGMILYGIISATA
jgi:hypothetical protein